MPSHALAMDLASLAGKGAHFAAGGFSGVFGRADCAPFQMGVGTMREQALGSGWISTHAAHSGPNDGRVTTKNAVYGTPFRSPSRTALLYSGSKEEKMLSSGSSCGRRAWPHEAWAKSRRGRSVVAFLS